MDIRSRMILFQRLLMLATVFLLLEPCSARGQFKTPDIRKHLEARRDTVTANVQPQNILQQGQRLEDEGQWAEALSLYQTAIKEFPGSQQLQERRTSARIHYELQRRYSDASFLNSLRKTSGSTSLSAYAEVLLKIQSYYVDEPDWNQLAESGWKGLEIAIQSPDFRKVNLPNVSTSEVDNVVGRTRTAILNQPVRNRHDLYVLASSTAKLLHRSIGLPVPSAIYEFTGGTIAALDPYSAFMSSSQYNETMSQIEGNFVGLGVELRTHADHLEIVSVIPGGPASIGNIAKGDRIIAVDKHGVTQTGSEKAADLLRGVEGSYVAITVERDGMKTQSVRLQRRRVEIPSVDDVKIIDPQNGTAYVRLTNFQKTTARDFDAALWKLHRAGMRSLIVDVRGNPGGLLSASVEVADRFVGSGVIVSTRGRNPLEDYTHRAEVAKTWRMPLVVLIDENSASASEIFAAAIRDHQRGAIVGRPSYGKGSVQGIFPLNVSGGGVRLTTAKFYSPNGTPINQIGVKPDVNVQYVAKAGADEDVELHLDNDIRIGIQVANRVAAQRQQDRRQSVAGRSR